MASIRKRGIRWQAQVRRKGAKPVSKTFHNRRDAEAWARSQEVTIESGGCRETDSDIRLGDLLQRYVDEITPAKKGREQETRRLKRLIRDRISRQSVAHLDGKALSEFRDRRLSDGVRACQYDLVLIRHAIQIARKEWGISLSQNPVDAIRVPNGIRSRNRRLEPHELAALRQAANSAKNPLIWPAVEFALATAMRRSEILKLQWSYVDFEKRVAFLQDTKNGDDRGVPLSEAALTVLHKLPRNKEHTFPTTEYALRQGWERLVKRAGIVNLRFHDLRHEAISRFFEHGLSVAEVALISGHKDVRVLFRYTHIKPELVALKLA